MDRKSLHKVSDTKPFPTKVNWTGLGLVGISLGLIWVGYTQGLGFQGKTFWDWMALLIILIALITLGVATRREFRRFEQQGRQERLLAERRAQHQREVETDRFQEAALQAYLGQIGEMLLDRGLGLSAPGSDIRSLARVRTLTVLRQLDGTRKGIVLQFLYNSGLIRNQAIVELNQADLRGADLAQADLAGAALSGVDLSGANLREADLHSANLHGSSLVVADLSGTDLCGADLSKTRLVEAVLILTNLSRANLDTADLHGANLEGANLNEANLRGANLHRTFLGRADLIGAGLSRANLRGADLVEADLREANLNGADLREAVLNGADLLEASLDGAQVTDQQLFTAKILKKNPANSRLSEPV